MTIRILISFVDRDNSTGKLTSYAQGDIVSNLSDEVANAFINAGLARVYTALGVAGNLSITANGQYDVADYAGATVNVPWFKNLVDRSITSVTADMLEGVTSIGDSAFQRCTSLASITIPENVTSIGDYVFQHCTSLPSIIIPESVTSIGDAVFYQCTSLASITIPENVPSIGTHAFGGCTSLSSIEIPNSVTSIGSYAFQNCSALTSVTMLATTPPTLGSDVFKLTHDDLKIYVPSASVSAYQAASGWSNYASKIQAISE